MKAVQSPSDSYNGMNESRNSNNPSSTIAHNMDFEDILHQNLEDPSSKNRTNTNNKSSSNTDHDNSQSEAVEALGVRFQRNLAELMSEIDGALDGDDRSNIDAEVVTKKEVTVARWGALKKTFVPKNVLPPQPEKPKPLTNEELIEDLEAQDIEFLDLWNDQTLPVPPTLEDESDALVGYEKGPPKVGKYNEEFQHGAAELGVNLSRVQQGVVENYEEKMESFLRSEQMQSVQKMKRQEADLLWREDMAHKRLAEIEEEARIRMHNEQLKLVDQNELRRHRMKKDFLQAKKQLIDGLAEQGATLREVYGEIGTDDVDSYDRRYGAELDQVPQPIELKIHCIRAIKTKLTNGDYSVMVSVFDRLGGRPLRYENIPLGGTADEPSVTNPSFHQGRFFDRNLSFEESVFTTLPPRMLRRPSNTLVIELFQLVGDGNEDASNDRVVAWAAIPICDEHLSCVEGKFKLPMLRGEHSPKVMNFKEIEQAIAYDLNTWLANIYLEIRVLPRPGLDKSKANLAFDFIRNLIVFPNSGSKDSDAEGEGDNRDGLGDEELGYPKIDNKVFRRKVDRNRASRSHSASRKIAGTTGGGHNDLHDRRSGRGIDKDTKMRNKGKSPSKRKGKGSYGIAAYAGQSSDDESARGGYTTKSDRSSSTSNSFFSNFISKKKSSRKVSAAGESSGDEDAWRDRPVVWERRFQDEHRLHPEQMGTLAGVDSIQDPDERAVAASTMNGRVVRRVDSDGPRFDSEAVIDPNDPDRNRMKEEAARALNNVHKDKDHHNDDHETRSVHMHNTNTRATAHPGLHRDWAPALHGEGDLDGFAMSLVADPSQRQVLLPNDIPAIKFSFIANELVGDFFPGRLGSFDSYIWMFVYLFVMWIAMFVHYMGCYFYLSCITPVYGFAIEGHQVSFKYMSDSMTDVAEMGVIVSGPISNAVLFVILAMVIAGGQKYAHFVLPESATVVIAAYGLITLINPLLIFFYNICAGNFNCHNVSKACRIDYTSSDCKCFNADFFKLYYRFDREEDSGITGLLLTFFVYGILASWSAFALYYYMIHVHKHAKILDLWRRIAAPPQEFFLPHDLEMSFDDLRSVIAMNLKWRGKHGERRRAAVSRFYEKDLHDHSFCEPNRYVAIYEVHGRTSKSIYRHFVIQADGAIMEIFGPFEVELIDDDDPNRLLQLSEADKKQKTFGDMNYIINSIEV